MNDRLPHEKGFHVSWDQLHRDARALAWRMDGTEWRAVVAVTRGGLVPAILLGIPGTPSWVYGDTVFEGAVGYQQLSEIVASNEG